MMYDAVPVAVCFLKRRACGDAEAMGDAGDKFAVRFFGGVDVAACEGGVVCGVWVFRIWIRVSRYRD